ncbi:MAG: hypothetical protein L6Q38_17130, partial [Nitrospira sp.]|nr:hypothetical protein [Nitrospira sp.]
RQGSTALTLVTAADQLEVSQNQPGTILHAEDSRPPLSVQADLLAAAVNLGVIGDHHRSDHSDRASASQGDSPADSHSLAQCGGIALGHHPLAPRGRRRREHGDRQQRCGYLRRQGTGFHCPKAGNAALG